MKQTNDYPKLCRDCRHSKSEGTNSWDTSCLHPKIVSGSPWALSHNGNGRHPHEISCYNERSNRSWFAKCGMKGRLFEDKTQNNYKLYNWYNYLDDKVGKQNPLIMDREMIQIRWLTDGTSDKPKLQYRTVKNYLEMGLHLPIWTEWEDVPTVRKVADYGSGSGGYVAVVPLGKGFEVGSGGSGGPT